LVRERLGAVLEPRSARDTAFVVHVVVNMQLTSHHFGIVRTICVGSCLVGSLGRGQEARTLTEDQLNWLEEEVEYIITDE